MKSFKRYLNEDEISPDAEPPMPNVDPDTGVVDKESCDRIQWMVDYYKRMIEEGQRSLEKAADKWSEACGGGDVDRAVWCAKYCGGGGEWGPQGWEDAQCMAHCLAEAEQHCQGLYDAMMAAHDNLSLMELFLDAYETDLAKNCAATVSKSTRKPSKKPNTGVTPIEPTIGPNIK